MIDHLPSQKAEIRSRWLSSDKANFMSVFELGQFLIALDDANTQEELEILETRWLKSSDLKSANMTGR
jgi:hypothetical protein